MRYLYENDSVLSRAEIRLFKYLNGKKFSGGNMLEIIQNMMPFLDKPKSSARYYLELYSLNYRPGGDYENITSENFNDVSDVKPKKTTNNTAYEYAAGKVPFKGSNLEAEWGVNLSGDRYYVVKSYGWYPIFLFINDEWYQVMDNYSSTTSKHISQSNPVRRYNSGLDSEVKLVTQEEIKSIMNGKSPDNVLNLRVSTFIDKLGPEITNIKKTKQIYDYENNFSAKVSYIITDVENVDGKIGINVKIVKAGKLDGRKMIEDPAIYDDERFMDSVKKGVEREIITNYRRYLTKNNTEFNFN